MIGSGVASLAVARRQLEQIHRLDAAARRCSGRCPVPRRDGESGGSAACAPADRSSS